MAIPPAKSSLCTDARAQRRRNPRSRTQVVDRGGVPVERKPEYKSVPNWRSVWKVKVMVILWLYYSHMNKTLSWRVKVFSYHNAPTDDNPDECRRESPSRIYEGVAIPVLPPERAMLHHLIKVENHFWISLKVVTFKIAGESRSLVRLVR